MNQDELDPNETPAAETPAAEKPAAEKPAAEKPKAKAPTRNRKKKDDGHLEAVADALSDAAVAIENGDKHVGEDDASERGPLTQAVYGASYGVSFGIVFPAMLIASILPTDNPFGHGLIDGAHAARDRVDHLKATREGSRIGGHEAGHPDATPATA